MGKRRRTRTQKQEDTEADVDINKEIDSISNPKESLLAAAGLKREEKEETKKVEEVNKPKEYKPYKYSQEPTDFLMLQFDKENYENVKSMKKKKHRISKFSTGSQPIIRMRYLQDGLTQRMYQRQMSQKFLVHPRLAVRSVLNRVNIASEIQDNDYKRKKYLETISILNSWHDMSYEYTGDNELKMLRSSYIFHCLNTILRQNELKFKNDLKDKEENDEEFKLKKMIEAELDDESDSDNEKEPEADLQPEDVKLDSPYIIPTPEAKFVGEEEKDQGFTRPKVLILTGYKKMAYYIINEIITQFNYSSWKKVIKKKRFKQEFDLNTEEAVNDCFKVGISFIKNEQIKLYENLIDSDIIVASPLGLRLITGQEGEQENRREYDFLSSVQIVILDQAETFLYQNVDHLEEVLKSTNKVPKSLDILNDINRIQEIYLEKIGHNFRQSVMIHNFRSMDLDCLARSYLSVNYTGHVEVNKFYPNNLLRELSLAKNTRITMRKLNTDSLELVDETRFTFFTKKLWQKLYENLGEYSILVANSYFEFVRLRNFLRDKNASVAYISEYSEPRDCNRNRSYYETGRKKFLLISERALYFQIVKLRYARNLIFYSLPESHRVFEELINLNEEKKAKFILKNRMNHRRKRRENTGEETPEPTEAEENKLVFGENIFFNTNGVAGS